MNPNTELIDAPAIEAPKLSSVGRDGARTGDGGPELRPGQGEGLEEDRRDRNQHDDAEIGEREAEGQAESRQHVGPFGFRCHPITCTLTSRLIDLVEHAAVAEKLRLRLFPSAKIRIDREQRQARELARVLRGDGLVARTEEILRDYFLPRGRVEKFQVRLRDRRRCRDADRPCPPTRPAVRPGCLSTDRRPRTCRRRIA